ncbi:MAG: DEAD/DEAH box helicase [Lachnospiraceae bacterium]|nr:SNF2-related protein [uncultured Acetatifactor sp.]MCI9571859.1 DEAD/DEAH box helicase [Lachnospiraceae bacterium]
MKTVPIEEINRDKRGIKTKPLRDCGYETVADIAASSVYEIALVRGISEDTAYTIHRIVRDIVSSAQKTIKIRLNLDKKTPESTRIVIAVVQYDRSVLIEKACRSLITANDGMISDAIDNLDCAANGLKWLLSFGAGKQRAIEAYEQLKVLLEGEYGQNVQRALTEVEELENVSDIQAWEEFERYPVRFFNILESVVPGLLGNDDSVYGLPENLVREIQDECFFPEGLLCELRRYQEWGVKYILHQGRALLGDEMGLGKTVQAIATMVSLKNTNATHFVVVCPASVITNWCREIGQKSKLRVTKVHGARREVALVSWVKLGGVAVTTYETTAYFVLGNDFKFSLMVVDEAHYIKNAKAQRSINVRKLCEHTERLLFMTGTALENNVDEMVSLIQILRPDIFLSIRGISFMAAAQQFREQIAPVYYRRKREDVLTELPELVESRDLNTIRGVCEILGNQCMNPINGSLSPQRRQEIIDEFNMAPAGTVLAAQIQSGGTGLNIQSASMVIICEPQLKPSIENQAISRAYRMGQTRNVLVYRLLCDNTVDEKVTEILDQKQKIFDAFADKSVAAQESIEVDDKTFGDIIKAEIERINAEEQVG